MVHCPSARAASASISRNTPPGQLLTATQTSSSWAAASPPDSACSSSCRTPRSRRAEVPPSAGTVAAAGQSPASNSGAAAPTLAFASAPVVGHTGNHPPSAGLGTKGRSPCCTQRSARPRALMVVVRVRKRRTDSGSAGASARSALRRGVVTGQVRSAAAWLSLVTGAGSSVRVRTRAEGWREESQCTRSASVADLL